MKEEDIKRVVKEAVKETLVTLGLTVDDPAEMQKDMHYLRNIRKGSTDVHIFVRRSGIWSIICIGAYLAVEGVRSYFNK